ncbi:hypothetical protein [Nocardia sp. NPDC051463]|uniref:hypothetical protein n=1 Tax=Nocardia sp. NPDC051463 TaxID=3154845 RepID=UPI00344DF7B8
MSTTQTESSVDCLEHNEGTWTPADPHGEYAQAVTRQFENDPAVLEAVLDGLTSLISEVDE